MASERLWVGDEALLRKAKRSEQTALVVDFLEEDGSRARAFIRYCSSRGGKDRLFNRCLVDLGRSLKAAERREEHEGSEAEKRTFIRRRGDFKRNCMEGKCIQDADGGEKRHARSDGDYYLEDSQGTFTDAHGGLQVFLNHTKMADKCFRQGDFRTAMRAYRILMDIYHHDTELEHCFVSDDDFPELDLSQVDGVDMEVIQKWYGDCSQAVAGRKK